MKFQHTAARRRLPGGEIAEFIYIDVSTHSRTEAAADKVLYFPPMACVSTHSRTEAAAITFGLLYGKSVVSTHSRTEAAARDFGRNLSRIWFQHTAARRRLHLHNYSVNKCKLFQHTAARRRLLVALCSDVVNF